MERGGEGQLEGGCSAYHQLCDFHRWRLVTLEVQRWGVGGGGGGLERGNCGGRTGVVPEGIPALSVLSLMQDTQVTSAHPHCTTPHPPPVFAQQMSACAEPPAHAGKTGNRAQPPRGLHRL